MNETAFTVFFIAVWCRF